MRQSIRTVLIAEDNADARETLATFLQLLGLEVVAVGDGMEAVEAAQRRLPDVAILDLGMPRLDGWATCQAIRALPGGAAITIVAFSGWGSAEVRQRSEAAGFNAHWTKPMDPESLLTMLRPSPTSPR